MDELCGPWVDIFDVVPTRWGISPGSSLTISVLGVWMGLDEYGFVLDILDSRGHQRSLRPTEKALGRGLYANVSRRVLLTKMISGPSKQWLVAEAGHMDW